MSAAAHVILDLLFASVWQGAAIAIAVAAVLFLAGRGLNAATRYLVLQGALVTIVVLPLLTVMPNVLSHAGSTAVQNMATGADARALVKPTAERAAAATRGSAPLPLRRIEVALSDRAALALVVAWMVGVLAFALRIGFGSLQLRRLLRRAKRFVDRGGVRVYASPDIAVPLTTGFITPAVIVPMALASAESQEELECVLLHELAHVSRGDAWANACERLLHALLFFNPAVSLMLRAIALEREAACDDWAVTQSRDLDTYVRSLAAVAIRGVSTQPVTAAFGAVGFANATITRIERLEDARHNGAVTLSHNALGGFTLMFAIIAFTLQTFAPAVAFAGQMPSAPAPIASTDCQGARILIWTEGGRMSSRLTRAFGPLPAYFPKGKTAEVATRVSPSGEVLDSAIVKSSGNAEFDHAAVAMATSAMKTLHRDAQHHAPLTAVRHGHVHIVAPPCNGRTQVVHITLSTGPRAPFRHWKTRSH